MELGIWKYGIRSFEAGMGIWNKKWNFPFNFSYVRTLGVRCGATKDISKFYVVRIIAKLNRSSSAPGAKAAKNGAGASKFAEFENIDDFDLEKYRLLAGKNIDSWF